MDSRKAILILGLLAMVLLISSEVSARDLTETSSETTKEAVEQTNDVNDAKYGGRGGGYHGGGGYNGGGYNHGGGGYNGGGGGYNHGGGGYNGGGGGYNHGGGGYNGGGGYHNGGGGGYNHGGGGCQYHCRGRCCSHAEFVAVQTEGNTHN